MPLKFFIFRKKNSVLKLGCLKLRIGTAKYEDEVVVGGPYQDRYTAEQAKNLYLDSLGSDDPIKSEKLFDEFTSII